MISIKVVLLIALVASQAMAGNRKCRALVMSGGGDKGSYEAQAVKVWTDLLSKEDMSYDVITGVSAGSLNGSFLGSYKPGDESEGADKMLETWQALKPKDAFKMWPGGVLEGIFQKQGIFDESPLRDFLKKVLGERSVQKKMGLGSVDMNTGEFLSYDYEDTEYTEDYWDSVIASTAMPLAFEPVKTRDGRTLLDGGVVWKMDVPGAIRRCLEIVDDEEDIILDAIMTAQTFLPEVDDVSDFTTLGHLRRGLEIKSYHKNMKIVNNTLIAHPKVNFRYILAPSVTLTISPIPLDLSQKHLEFCYGVAKKDATAAVRLGPGGYMNMLLEHTEKLQNGEDSRLDQMLETKLQLLEAQEAQKAETTAEEVLKSE
eukprot:CAMPEP_0196994324 /NCGR_PEP_ID=MMETSP1380-20130617/631_1 /TAXON_ID=5936 /ORGANISM="Euplotes crassus, Strain CT5" /LENGTH=370 /DNA_ID=CAMNT_0042409663 /DNA_START=14 /DNA_END=1126 /DNA_ORIENTATION=-